MQIATSRRLSYDAWGKQRDPDDWTLPDEFAALGVVNLGYTGHEAQEDAGLINMSGRLYDPHLGRMINADPVTVDPTSTQAWNRYAYVLNRPLSLTDPSGFSPAPSGVCLDSCEMEADEVEGSVSVDTTTRADPGLPTPANQQVGDHGPPSVAGSAPGSGPGDVPSWETFEIGSLFHAVPGSNPLLEGVSAMHELSPTGSHREQ